MSTRPQFSNRISRLAALPAVLIVALLVVAPAAAGRGDCINAFIDETIVLPDGSLHPPGTLRICLVQPGVGGLHKTSVDGRTIGVFQSLYRATPAPPEDPRPVMVFRRDPRGGLVLLGYTLPRTKRTEVYWMQEAGRRGPRHRDATVPLNLAGLAESGSEELEFEGLELVQAALR